MRSPISVWCVVLSLLAAVLAIPCLGAQDWSERNKGKLRPPARSNHAMVYDSVRKRVVLFGGYHVYTGFFNDIWEWDGSAWTQLKPGVSPPVRGAHAMAYDSARQRVVLFGGTGLKGMLADTWEWDGITWTQRTPATNPPATGMFAMAYDPVRKRTVYFAGNGDTWEWDGINWTKRQPATIPAGRSNYAMVYDAARGRIVMFGGSHGITAWSNELWEWDGTNWRQRKPAVSPPGRYSHAMAYDAARRKIVLFGGDSMAWWQNDTWEWDGSNWGQRWPVTNPSKRVDHTMVYDASRFRVVLFGGMNLGGIGTNDTWEYGFPATLVLTGASRIGTTVSLALTAAEDGGLGYQVGSSMGTGPIPIDYRLIGLSPDVLLGVSVSDLWPWIFSGYRGVLDSRGQAQAAIHIPNLPPLVGTRIHTAFVTLDPQAPSGIKSIGNTVSFVIAK
jgi:hypothetical protein